MYVEARPFLFHLSSILAFYPLGPSFLESHCLQRACASPRYRLCPSAVPLLLQYAVPFRRPLSPTFRPALPYVPFRPVAFQPCLPFPVCCHPNDRVLPPPDCRCPHAYWLMFYASSEGEGRAMLMLATNRITNSQTPAAAIYRATIAIDATCSTIRTTRSYNHTISRHTHTHTYIPTHIPRSTSPSPAS